MTGVDQDLYLEERGLFAHLPNVGPRKRRSKPDRKPAGDGLADRICRK